VVWKFGGTSVGDPDRLRAVARRLVTAARDGVQVVAVLSAMGGCTDDLTRLAHGLSARPAPRELDALLSVGESISCALAAIAVWELGVPAVSLSGAQAGVHTDSVHGNARMRVLRPVRVVEALERGSVVLVTGFQGIGGNGDVTTLGRGGSDASAIALAAALGLAECDIFTDVAGVFTADPRIVPDAALLPAVGIREMQALADAGAGVLQPQAVRLAGELGVDVHVRSSFTEQPGTWVRRDPVAGVGGPGVGAGVVGVAHRGVDPVYTVRGGSARMIPEVLAGEGLAAGGVVQRRGRVLCTAGGAEPGSVVAALSGAGAQVSVHRGLGSVSVITGPGAGPAVGATVLSALAARGISAELVLERPGRVTCHVPAAAVPDAARAVHRAFGLHRSAENALTAGPAPAELGRVAVGPALRAG
jgi:aspartate kinase